MARTLDDAETRELIASVKVGRLGCVVEGEPYVVPINYLFEDGAIMVTSLPGRKIINLRRIGVPFTEVTMKRISLGTNFAIFALFFGIATLEAFQTRNWLKAALWVALGTMFLVADNLRVKDRRR